VTVGAAFFAALKIAKRFKENKNIVVILPNTDRNYISKIYF
jgi:cysteine synthase